MRSFPKTIWLVALLAFAASAQQETQVTGWKMQDSAVVGATSGTVISTASYNSATWYAATVPGTVLRTYVDRGVYPNPLIGLNMLNIPDLANQQKRYWYQATFTVSPTVGQRVWLEFGGINYYATIFCNGTQIGTMYGAFKEAKFDVTSLVNSSGTNYVAIKIQGNYHPGTYHQQQTGSCGSNGGTMSQDGPTFIASQGWDWVPTIPDRDMGIWKPVYVRVTGPVALRHPWIKTLNVSTTSATVPLQVMLNNGSSLVVSGTVNADINGTTQFTPQTVTVPAAETLNVNFPNLTMTNPNLWWPNGYGAPNLYTCHISFTPTGGTAVSDTLQFQFGVRQFTYTATPSLTISCNGQRILARGGNWGMDDAMKRWNLHKLENEVKYHKDMNFNIIRDWIGMTDCEPFYQYCDQNGIMVWSDFWEPHSADAPTPPSDQTNFIANMGDKIYRARNHASIAIWCERNETTPTAAFLTALTNFHTNLDGTRYVQSSSGCCGAHSGGPYSYTLPPAVYGQISGYHTEFGCPHIPTYQSMVAMMPASDLGSPWGNPSYGNADWSFHNGCSGDAYFSTYTTDQNTEWGTATSMQDFCTKAQLMNYDEGRAAEEALSAKRFNGATGLMLWMSQSCWPSLVWQTYDYFMDPTGMYGYQKGSEPVHVMYYGTGSYQVSVVNNSRQALSNYSVTAGTYNLNGSKAWSQTNTAVNVSADAALNIFPITAGASTPYFLDLKLRDASGNIVSKNFYWLPSTGGNISGMMSMAKDSNVVQTAAATWTKGTGTNVLTLKIVNKGTVPAVACQLMVTGDSINGARILPVHYNDNLFSLIPGDTQSVSIEFDSVDLGSHYPVLTLQGVNVPLMQLTIGIAVAVRQGVENNVRTSGIYSLLAGSKLRVFNVPTSSSWEVKIFDMQGRMVINAQGAQGQAAVVPLNGLHAGAYVATVKAAGESFRTMLTLTRHMETR